MPRLEPRTAEATSTQGGSVVEADAPGVAVEAMGAGVGALLDTAAAGADAPGVECGSCSAAAIGNVRYEYKSCYQ